MAVAIHPGSHLGWHHNRHVWLSRGVPRGRQEGKARWSRWQPLPLVHHRSQQLTHTERNDTFRIVSEADKRQRPGRPRDANREASILAVVRELVAEVGYDKTSFEEVARRASASKPTLYRRWPTRQDMVVAALKAAPSGVVDTPVDTGSLREDLLILCRRLAETLRTTDVALTAALLQAGLKDPELCQDMETSMGFTGARLPVSVLRNAVDRGELPCGASPFAYEEVTGSVLVLRAMNGLPLDEDYLRQLIDTVLLPALARPATQPGVPGIFSGQAH